MEKYTWRAVIKEGMKEEYIRRHDTDVYKRQSL